MALAIPGRRLISTFSVSGSWKSRSPTCYRIISDWGQTAFSGQLWSRFSVLAVLSATLFRRGKWKAKVV